MKRILVTLSFVVVAVSLTGAVLADCDTNMVKNGVRWEFHRMDDGNQYHETDVKQQFAPGEVLALDLPCPDMIVNTVQIEWDDMRGKMSASLYTYPGNKNHGSRDVGSPKSRESWTIEKATSRIEFHFSGRKQAMVKWIRVFYGRDMKSGKQIKASNDLKYDQRIHMASGPLRSGKVITYRDNVFTIEFTNGGREKLGKGAIRRIEFPRNTGWGSATGKNGATVPFQPILYHDGLIDFVKKENVGPITKTDLSIETFAVINFPVN